MKNKSKSASNSKRGNSKKKRNSGSLPKKRREQKLVDWRRSVCYVKSRRRNRPSNFFMKYNEWRSNEFYKQTKGASQKRLGRRVSRLRRSNNKRLASYGSSHLSLSIVLCLSRGPPIKYFLTAASPVQRAHQTSRWRLPMERLRRRKECMLRAPSTTILRVLHSEIT